MPDFAWWAVEGFEARAKQRRYSNQLVSHGDPGANGPEYGSVPISTGATYRKGSASWGLRKVKDGSASTPGCCLSAASNC